MTSARAATLEAVQALAPEFRARAAEGEALRTMPADLAARVKRAGLFRLALPRALGGWELDPATLVEIVEQLSCADGSAGWSVFMDGFFHNAEDTRSEMREAGFDMQGGADSGVPGPKGNVEYFVLACKQ